MATNDLPTASIENDYEWAALFAGVTGGEGRPTEQWDSVVCTECERGDSVVTEERTRGLATVERHVCERCDVYGATAYEGGVAPGDMRLWTKGAVKTVDLEKSENEVYRGTF